MEYTERIQGEINMDTIDNMDYIDKKALDNIFYQELKRSETDGEFWNGNLSKFIDKQELPIGIDNKTFNLESREFKAHIMETDINGNHWVKNNPKVLPVSINVESHTEFQKIEPSSIFNKSDDEKFKVLEGAVVELAKCQKEKFNIEITKHFSHFLFKSIRTTLRELCDKRDLILDAIRQINVNNKGLSLALILPLHMNSEEYRIFFDILLDLYPNIRIFFSGAVSPNSGGLMCNDAIGCVYRELDNSKYILEYDSSIFEIKISSTLEYGVSVIRSTAGCYLEF